MGSSRLALQVVALSEMKVCLILLACLVGMALAMPAKKKNTRHGGVSFSVTLGGATAMAMAATAMAATVTAMAATNLTDPTGPTGRPSSAVATTTTSTTRECSLATTDTGTEAEATDTDIGAHSNDQLRYNEECQK